MQRRVRAGVEPGEAAAQHLDVKLAALEIGAVDIGDLELAARRRLEARGDVDHLVVVEIEAGHGPVATSALRASPRSRSRGRLRVELDDAVALGIGRRDRRRPWRRLAVAAPRSSLGQAVAVEDVVAEDQSDAVVADEVAADDEGLGQSRGLGLRGVGEVEAQLRAVAEQRSNSGRSCGVEMIRMSRMPASISVDSG